MNQIVVQATKTSFDKIIDQLNHKSRQTTRSLHRRQEWIKPEPFMAA